MPSKRLIYNFRITLLDTDPPIWRRIAVPENYSFWDLHVAIQDAMGWLDCHLHVFRFGKAGSPLMIGIPFDEGFSDIVTLPGWETPIKEYFDVGKPCVYEYDFGDGWIHELVLQEIVPAEKGTTYPVCLDGAMACPPEDCGGVPGYYHLLEVLNDPEQEEYEDLLAWLGGPYDPGAFLPSEITFDNPGKRLQIAFPPGI